MINLEIPSCVIISECIIIVHLFTNNINRWIHTNVSQLSYMNIYQNDYNQTQIFRHSKEMGNQEYQAIKMRKMTACRGK